MYGTEQMKQIHKNMSFQGIKKIRDYKSDFDPYEITNKRMNCRGPQSDVSL